MRVALSSLERAASRTLRPHPLLPTGCRRSEPSRGIVPIRQKPMCHRGSQPPTSITSHLNSICARLTSPSATCRTKACCHSADRSIVPGLLQAPRWLGKSSFCIPRRIRARESLRSARLLSVVHCTLMMCEGATDSRRVSGGYEYPYSRVAPFVRSSTVSDLSP